MLPIAHIRHSNIAAKRRVTRTPGPLLRARAGKGFHQRRLWPTLYSTTSSMRAESRPRRPLRRAHGLAAARAALLVLLLSVGAAAAQKAAAQKAAPAARKGPPPCAAGKAPQPDLRVRLVAAGAAAGRLQPAAGRELHEAGTVPCAQPPHLAARARLWGGASQAAALSGRAAHARARAQGWLAAHGAAASHRAARAAAPPSKQMPRRASTPHAPRRRTLRINSVINSGEGVVVGWVRPGKGCKPDSFK